MRKVRKLFFAGVAALMLAAMASASASAVTVTSPAGTPYNGNILGTNVGTVNLTTGSGIGNVSCENSTISGDYLNGNGTAQVNYTITNATWTNCFNNLGQTCTATAQNLDWSAAVTAGGANGANGTMTTTSKSGAYAGATVLCGSIDCFYGTSSAALQLYNAGNASAPGGPYAFGTAIANVGLVRESGSSAFCAANATWEATYKLETDPGGADVSLS